MRKILTKSRKQYLMVAVITAAVLITAFTSAYFIFFNHVRAGYEETIQNLESNKRRVLVAKEKISAGSQITEGNTESKEVFDNLPPEYFVSPEDLGKLALVNLEEGTHILRTMIASNEIEGGLREEEFSLFYLNSNLKENDFVDIRLMFPNGENYIVVSKKSIKNLNSAGNNCFLWLSEEEILTISGSIVDAYLHEGSKLYTSKYIEPTIQGEAIPTYTPNQDIIELIQNDPNVLKTATQSLSDQVRADLEKRLELFEEKNGETMNWDREVVQKEAVQEEVQEEEPPTYSIDSEEIPAQEEGGDAAYVE